VWLGHHKEAQQAILMALHDSGIGGHSGVKATYYKVKNLFAWPRMKQDVEQYVVACTVCKQAKSEHTKTPGTLQPLPITDQAWTIISMDFIEGLPKSHNYDTILVVIDNFSKYGHFVPMKHPYTALTIAKLFMDNVYKLHGLPQVIISDKDKVFTGELWKELFRLADTTINLSSVYHPQTDGQTERLNQCLETYLRCMVHACPTKWSQWLSQTEHWYNTTYHSALGKTPFEVLYAYPPRNFGLVAPEACGNADMDKWLTERSAMTQLMQQHLQRSQHRMKQQADKHRQERQFAIGDWVYLKLQPYVQMSVAPRSNQKLSYKFFGPYLVLEHVVQAAYKLQLPPNSRIHPVVHVSQLKKVVPPSVVVSSDESLLCLSDEVVISPAEVIDTKLLQVGSSALPHVLIRWAGLPNTWTTSENKNELTTRYPLFGTKDTSKL
jgi:hypothetical protein